MWVSVTDITLVNMDSLTERCKVHAEQDTLIIAGSLLFYCGTHTYHRHAGARQWAAPLKTVFCPSDSPPGSARPPPQRGTERRRAALTSRRLRLCDRAPPTPVEWLQTVNDKLTEHVQTNTRRLCPFQRLQNIDHLR